MLNFIIGFSIRNKLLVGMGIVLLTGWGAYSLSRLPIDAVPDITDNQVMVITTSPSLGASDIERFITFPVEQATRNIPGIVEQRSFSRFGLSVVTIVFDDATDVYWARQQVSEKLVQVQSQIPEGMGNPELGPVTTGLGEIYQYVVRAKPGYEKQYSAMELRTIQDWIVRRQLLGTEGVADVSSFGGELKQYEIAVDPARLKAHNLTITDVFHALEKNNGNTGGAYIEKGPTVLYIRSEGLVRSQDDIGNILVAMLPDGSPLRIRDVAKTGLGHATRYGALSYNNEGEVAGAVVMMLKGGNSSQVIEEVKRKIAAIEKTLPEGVMIEPFLDRTKMVNNAISTVETNLLEGALIVVFVLVLFLGNLRAGFLVASVIPLAMLFAVIMMNLFGVSGNLMSLGALDFGLIVDGAVIIVEAVMHRLRHFRLHDGQKALSVQQMDAEVKHASGRMMNAAVFGQAIILIVYLPILSLRGIEGKMFAPMAQTVTFAIIGAFILSLTYVPMMSAVFLSRKPAAEPGFSDRMMKWLEKVYRQTLGAALRRPGFVIGSTVVLFVFALAGLFSLGGEFIPELEEGDFAVETRVLTGSSLSTSVKSVQQAAHVILRDFPEVEKVVTKTGSGEIPTDPMPMEASDMMIILKPKNEWTSAKSFDELAEKMSAAVAAEVPGVTTGFQYPVQMRFNELMTGARQDVVCKIFGENLDSLAYYAEKVGKIVNSVDGAKDLYVETVTGLPQIVVEYNREAISQYGLSIDEVNHVIEAAFAGAVSGQVFENERRFDLVVRLDQENRRSPEDVENLLVATPSGIQVPLRQFADVSVQVGPNQIQREDAQRRISVGFNVRGRDVETIVKELQGKIDTQIKLPPGYFIDYGGQFENLTAAKKRLSIAVPGSLLLIFILLYFAFNSVRQGLLIYSAIPLSAIGGVFALLLRGMPFSISAGVGFIALFGVAVLNGIVMITEFNHLKKTGFADIRERIFTGASTRLRPVLMTAAVASLGFLPMAVSSGAGAEVQRPLATVVIGGLISATLLTLLVLPALYLLTEKQHEKKQGNREMKKQLPLSAGLLLIILLSLPSSSQAQTISLQAAIDSAMKQNPEVLAAALRVRAQQQEVKTGWDIPRTTASAEFGQVNSPATDSKFGLSQSIAFPLVYHREKQVLQAQAEAEIQQEALVRLEVRRQLSSLYYRMIVLQERKKLLLHTDSLYAAYLLRQEERLNAGDADLLEKLTAESQRAQIAAQLRELEADLEITQIGFSRLMNSTRRWLPETGSPKMIPPALDDTASLARHPSLLLRQQDIRLSVRRQQLERSRLLPLFVFGYYNQSFAGWQYDPGGAVFNTRSARYSSVMVGLEIPLFFRAGLARTRSADFRLQAARFDYAAAYANRFTEWQQLRVRQQTNAGLLAYYETTGLGQATLIEQRATEKLRAGDIGFYDWMLMMNQAVSIRSAYLSAVEEWNNSSAALNALSN